MSSVRLFPHLSLVACLLLSFLAAARPARAATIPVYGENFDTLSSATLNANGWYFWNSNAAGTAWTVNTLTTDWPPLQGRVLRNPAGGAANTSAMLQFTPVTLSATGDFLSVSLDVYSTVSDTTKMLQIGFYDVGATLTGNVLGGANPIADKTGYVRGQAFNTSTASYSERLGTTSVSGSSSGAIEGAAFTANAPHTITFTLTKTSGGLSLSSTFDGVVMSDYTLSSVTGDVTLDTLWLLTGGVASAVNFDNITITTNAIPEPSTAAALLGGVVLLGAFVLKRRRDSHV